MKQFRDRRLAPLRHSVLCLLVAFGAAASAQTWPARPVRIIVPFAAGGVSDVVARTVANGLSQAIGQAVIVENKPGAQGLLGSVAAKNAASDGYTLVLMSSSVACVNPYLRKSMPFNPQADFDAVEMIGSAPLMMLVAPTLGIKTVDQFLVYAKANLGKLGYSTPGIGGSAHLYSESLNRGYKLDLAHLPYQGGVPAVQALLAGDVTMTMADMSFADAQVGTGRLVALAVAGDKRWPRLPNVPTFAEAGYALNLVGWVGLMAPAGTPKPVVQRINAELKKITSAASNADTLLRVGVLAGTGQPEDMAHAVREGCLPWGEAVKNAGIQPE